MIRPYDVFHYSLCLAAWVAIAHYTEGIGWAIYTVLGAAHLGFVVCMVWKARLE